MTRKSEVYVNQLWELTLAEWKLREQSTVLGFLWTLLSPLLMYSALYLVFTRWMRNYMSNYPAYLLIGVVEYGFFNGATTYGISSLNRRRGILTNFKIPREIIVFSACLSVTMSYSLELILMLIFVLCFGTVPHWSWLLFPVILTAQLFLVVGLALYFSLLAVRYPDFERIWSLMLSIGFFLTPIFYTIDSVGADRKKFLWLNPMTYIIEWSRTCLLRSQIPHAYQLSGLMIGSLTIVLAGYALFKNKEIKISEHLLP